MANLDPALVEKAARKIACETVGDYSTLYEDKREWTDDRGRRHDVNTPFKSDMRDAARAALLSLGIPAAALNALAKGEAVVVPKVRTREMITATPFLEDSWDAQLAASPYRSEP